MELKTFKAAVEFKEDDEKEGQFEAIFATLDVIDLDGDVTVEGAFKKQNVVIEPWNHGQTLPAGKGQIYVDGKKAKVKGEFFMDTTVGRENYLALKALGSDAEWSYTFRILKAGPGEINGQSVRFLQELDVAGVSPVTRGAGIGTRTDSIKSDGSQSQADQNDKPQEDEDEAADPGKSRDQVDIAIMIAEAEMIIRQNTLS